MSPDFIGKAREFAPRFGERAALHDREGSFPFENFDELREAGFLKLTVPRSRGGYEAGLTTYLGVQEALARGDGSTALAFMMHTKLFGAHNDSPSWPAGWFREFCRGAVEDGWLCNTVATEEGLGSPAGGGLPDTTAVAVEGGWILNGRKTFTTMAPVLKYFIVMARIDGEAGAPPEIANFVVYREDPGVRIDETWDALGMRATGSHDLVVEECRLPPDRLATRRSASGGDARGAAGMAWFALGIAATTIGVAQAAFEYALDFARERTPNSQATISAFPGVRMRLGRIALLLQRSRAMVYEAARAWEAGGQERLGALPLIAGAKIDTLNNCIEAVDLAMRVVGGVSLQKSRPIERYYRDVRAGLHNPPIEDRGLEMIARAALEGASIPPHPASQD